MIRKKLGNRVRAGVMLMMAAGSTLMADEGWPELTSEAKPWTRWWWLGSGVDERNLTRELENFAAAGMGGVEICPIYGAKGYEERDREFLSEKWLAALAHTTREARRLGLGVDLTTGTGWPFGGPWVDGEIASQGLERVKKDLKGGERFRKQIEGKLIAMKAVPSGGGEKVDLGLLLKDGVVDWKAPEGGTWSVYGLISRAGIQKVKRAAPGGAGWVLDPYSKGAMREYLGRFDEAFKGFKAPLPRAHFHDSFEYYGAEWTTDLLAAFESQHGYQLLDQLPAFLGDGDEAARVQADWRATLSNLHRGYLSEWHDWANNLGSLTRNQAHGSPGNVLDHYAVADIPETEIFRKVEAPQIPTMGLAASAAHLSGRKLVSAESFTWLGEHFQVEPAALKEAADFLFLSGVNHLLYHGIPYSPEDAEWPGWLFYASTHMGPNGGLWRDLPAFNAYLGRAQSILQGGRPDSEVMMYFPFDDLISKESGKLPLFTIHNQTEWMHGTAFHQAAMEMWENGVPYEAVSGRLLEEAKVENGRVVLGDVKAKVLLVPGAKLMPVEVIERIRALSQKGAAVVFLDGLPEDVPGFGKLAERRKSFKSLRDSLPEFAVASELLPALKAKGVEAEAMAAAGLRMMRRARNDGYDYFVVNRGEETVDDSFSLLRPFESVVLLDPADAGRGGLVATGNGKKVRLVLEPGESVVVRCFDRVVKMKPYDYRVPAGEAVTLGGSWQVKFLEGGPTLPTGFKTEFLGSWTERDDSALQAFSGMARYSLEFDRKTLPKGDCLVDLGEVGTTCRVSLNGQPLGSSFFPPHRFEVGELLKEKGNLLEVEVTNLAANRIADLDRRGIEWKRFHEINFVNIDYKLFDASNWEPKASGLMGPVKLVPLR